MIFYHVLSEAIFYQGKLSDLNNTLINSQYLEKPVCEVLVLQSYKNEEASFAGGAHPPAAIDPKMS